MDLRGFTELGADIGRRVNDSISSGDFSQLNRDIKRTFESAFSGKNNDLYRDGLDGKLYRGANDMAGEAGHIRLSAFGPVGYGKAGSFEGFCSGGGIAQLAEMIAKEKQQMGIEVTWANEKITAKTVADAARKGDALAKEVYEICGEKLGVGLSVLIDILNPQKIVLGSIFKRSSNLIWPYAKEVIDREALGLSSGVCEVVPAQLDENLGDIAAIATALYN